MLAATLETNRLLQQKVEDLSLENEENLELHKEDVAQYEQVLQGQYEHIGKLLELQRTISDEKKSLAKMLEENSRLLEKRETEMLSLKEQLLMSEEEKDGMADEVLELEKAQRGIESGRRASI